MFNIIKLAVVLMVLLGNHAMADEQKKKGIIIVEESFESEKLQIRMSNDLTGTVVGRICDHCPEQTVTITPDTKAFEYGNPVPLINAKKRYGKSALVIFDVETKKINVIRWPL